MTNRLSNEQIKTALTELRVALREGKQRIGMENPNALQNVVEAALRGLLPEGTVVLDSALFSRTYMHPTTASRFEAFFGEAPVARVAPDDVAWALQNFMNRRADPWKFWFNRNVDGVEGNTTQPEPVNPSV